MCVCLYETCKFLPNLTRSAFVNISCKHPFSVIRVILLELVPNTLNTILGNTEGRAGMGTVGKVSVSKSHHFYIQGVCSISVK